MAQLLGTLTRPNGYNGSTTDLLVYFHEGRVIGQYKLGDGLAEASLSSYTYADPAEAVYYMTDGVNLQDFRSIHRADVYTDLDQDCADNAQRILNGERVAVSVDGMPALERIFPNLRSVPDFDTTGGDRLTAFIRGGI